jgi:hypothetical protein
MADMPPNTTERSVSPSSSTRSRPWRPAAPGQVTNRPARTAGGSADGLHVVLALRLGWSLRALASGVPERSHLRAPRCEGRLAPSRLQGAVKGSRRSWPMPAVLRLIPDTCLAARGRGRGAAASAVRLVGCPQAKGHLAVQEEGRGAS